MAIRWRKTRARGFTLVELLIGISITSMVGLTVAGASMVLSNSHFQSEQYYDCLQSGRVAMRWIESDIRRSSLVTGIQGGLMLWEGDTNGDEQINLSELTLITHDPNSGELTRSRAVFPAGMTSQEVMAINPQFPLHQLVESADAMASWVASNAFVETMTLASNIKFLDIQPAQTPPMTTRLNIVLVATQGVEQMTLGSAACLRADRTGDVFLASGQFILTNSWPVP